MTSGPVPAAEGRADHWQMRAEEAEECYGELRAERDRYRAALMEARGHLAEAQRWTDSGGECAIHIDDAEAVIDAALSPPPEEEPRG